MEKYGSEITKLYIALIVAFIPLYYVDNYYGILGAKTHMIYVLSLILFVLMIPCVIIQVLQLCKNGTLRDDVIKNTRSMDAILLIFAMVSIVSSLNSQNVRASLYGSECWEVGSVFIVLSSAIYFLISRFFSAVKKDVFVYLYFGTLAIIVFSIFDRLGIDLLDMFTGIVWEYDIFTSTIGNIDIYAGIISLFLPVFCIAPLQITNNFYKLSVYALVYMGFLNMYIVLTNTIFVGIGVALIFVIYYSLLDYSRIKNLGNIGIAFGLAGLTVRKLDLSWTIRVLDHDSIVEVVFKYRLDIVMLVLSILVLLGLLIIDKQNQIMQDRIKHLIEKRLSKMYLILVGLLCVITVVIIIANANLEMANYRGYIWYMSWKGFCEGSIAEKIIGYGPGLIDSVIQPQIQKSSLEIVRDYWYQTAHNEFIEYLVTTGLLGAGCYLCMIASIIVSAIGVMKREHSACPIMILAGMIGYLAQALATGPYAPNYITFFVFLGIWEAYLRSEA